ncbi:MAG: PilZ domain-containing protein [Spirochaetales bacterium]|nr:PilZ domain-containing protein [Spirochaetales bacterium]
MEAYTDDRRSWPRHDADWPVYLRKGGAKKQIGEVAGISLSGVRVVLNDTVEIGSDGAVYDLYLCSQKTPMDLLNISGHAVWSESREHTITIGLSLDGFDETVRNMLSEYIARQEDLVLQMDLEM